MLDNISPEFLKDQFKSNKKLRLSTFIVGGIAVLALGFFAYRQFIWNPANEKSKDNYYIGLNYAAKDSTDLAVEELGAHVKKYDGKIGGEVAQFVYARQLMQQKEYSKALEELQGVKVKDTYISAMSVGLQADCYSEMKKYEEAANLYLEAAEINANEMTTPMYLMKAGLCAEELKDFEQATVCYERIRDDYPAYASQKAIEKYIERAKYKTTK